MPVGARLRLFNWDHLPLTSWHRRILEVGLRWHWVALPPLSDLPRFIPLPQEEDKRVTLVNEVQALITKQALIPADPSTPGFYSHLFVVPKKTGGFRPVIDLKALNQFITCRTF